MSSTSRQVRSYYEHLADLVEPVTAAEVVADGERGLGQVHPTVPSDPWPDASRRRDSRRPSQRAWWPGIAAAVVILVVGALSVFLMVRPGGQPTAPSSTTTSVVEESSTTTVASAVDGDVSPTTEAADAPLAPLGTPALVSEETLAAATLGNITWTRYSALKGTIPEAEILFEPDRGFVAYPQLNKQDPQGASRAYEWRSDDAITWARRPIPVFDDFDTVYFRTGWGANTPELGWWATARTGDSVTYFVLDGDSWTPITLDDADRPAEESGGYAMYVGQPVASGNVTLFATGGERIALSQRVGELWIGDRGATLQWVPNPVPDNVFDFGVPIEPMPGGGFVMYEELDDDVVVFWGSPDGRSWSELGMTTFPIQGRGGLRLDSWSGGLRMFVMSETAPTYVMESTDAINWREAHVSTPLGQTFETSFGYVGVSLEPIEGSWQISASADGQVWTSIPIPPALAQPRISGAYYEGVAGDVVYRLIVAETGEVHYWIGRFG